MGYRLYKIYYFCVRVILEAVAKVVFGIRFWGVKSNTLPPISNLLLIEPAISLAQKIRSGKVTSEEVVKSFIARIREINPILNAVVDERFEEALEEAKEVDKFLRSTSKSQDEISKEKPFLGVPFTVKDCFCVKGLKQTAGLYARKDFVAEKDADNVRLMKEAGAIILGVTNVSELCMWWESSNTIYGRTNNPYNTNHIVGGSSGGEGCLQAASGSPVGIGSDIGGSIRMPCFFNGIFGHKPSSGIVSNRGEEPEAVGALQNYLVTGPMCRFACDLIPVYKVLASSNVHMLTLDKKVNLKDIKIYYMENDGGNPALSPVERELKLAQQKVLDHFKRAYKITPVKVEIKYLIDSVRIYFAKLGEVKEAPSFASELVLKKGELDVYKEFIKCLFGMSKHTFPALFLALFEKTNHNNTENPKLFHYCDKMKMEFKNLLGEDGIFLYPSHPTTAPRHGEPLFRPFNFAYTAILNIMGVPVTQCPLGLSSKGLPLGNTVNARMKK
ncbi:Fatty-acid amide hydrolase 2 [Armadillidium nasatum]|uniref:Fatty-acid amide hydrolase 2 n=1 Tax=Armadillidium nasatum TaxID=96803 RepID=A0A5N5SMJ3_9CRUS|nr:Fatty-acid amide hydrolase 2 [Armadillidium nasatum]